MLKRVLLWIGVYSNKMKKIAIIPARGGSKRIPRKNIRDFLGKPIIAYSIEAALKSKLFDEVMVSTDDNEIAGVSNKYGASIPFIRSKKNSDDFSTTADVLLEVLDQYREREKVFEYFCCIYPTALFVTSQKIRDSFKILLEEKTDSIIPVVKFSYPIQRAFRLNKKGNLEYLWQENINKRSQDLESSFHDAGQFYWKEVNTFLESKQLVSKTTFPLIVPELEVQDIDSENDWKLAEIKFKYLGN